MTRHTGTRTEGGFNGATSFQTWKWHAETRVASGAAVLQWGHVFSDVEIADSGSDDHVTSSLQWGHVFSDVEIPSNVTTE